MFKDILFLKVFVAFIDDIRDTTGVNINQIAIRATFSPILYYNCKRIIRGQNAFIPRISLNFIVYLSKFYSVNFDLSKYLAVIAEQDRLKLLSEVPSDDLPT